MVFSRIFGAKANKKTTPVKERKIPVKKQFGISNKVRAVASEGGKAVFRSADYQNYASIASNAHRLAREMDVTVSVKKNYRKYKKTGKKIWVSTTVRRTGTNRSQQPAS